MKESAIEQHLVRRVHKLHGEVRKVQWVGRRHAPDRLVMLPPDFDGSRSFFVELKRPGKSAEPGQAREHTRLREFGFRVYVADTKELVDEILDAWAK